MKSKIMVMAIAALLCLTVFAMKPVAGHGEEAHGYAIASEYGGDWYADGNVQWTDGTNYSGNIIAIELDDVGVSPNGSDDANNYGFGANANDDYDNFIWDAGSGEPKGYLTPPDTIGEEVMYLGQYEGTADGLNNNYVFCANLQTLDNSKLPLQPTDLLLRYEPIPAPQENPNLGTEWNGTDYLNITIPHFKYTDTNNTGGAHIENRGTADVFHSYSVYLDGSFYANTAELSAGADSPLGAWDTSDPGPLDTGTDYINITGLTAGTTYTVEVRPNFDTTAGGAAHAWGPDGGGAAGGAITTNITDGHGMTFTTDPTPTPDFPGGILVPVIATIGMFAAFTVYRRRKDE